MVGGGRGWAFALFAVVCVLSLRFVWNWTGATLAVTGSSLAVRQPARTVAPPPRPRGPPAVHCQTSKGLLRLQLVPAAEAPRNTALLREMVKRHWLEQVAFFRVNDVATQVCGKPWLGCPRSRLLFVSIWSLLFSSYSCWFVTWCPSACALRNSSACGARSSRSSLRTRTSVTSIRRRTGERCAGHSRHSAYEHM